MLHVLVCLLYGIVNYVDRLLAVVHLIRHDMHHLVNVGDVAVNLYDIVQLVVNVLFHDLKLESLGGSLGVCSRVLLIYLLFYLTE